MPKKNYGTWAPERGRFPERDKLEDLLEPLFSKYGKEEVLKNIEVNTDGISPEVIKNWLSGMAEPSRGIKTAIFSYLDDFKPGSLHEIPPVILTKRPQAEQKSDQPIDKKRQKRGMPPARQKNILDNERTLKELEEKLRQKGRIL
jgi:hypothetical protein